MQIDGLFGRHKLRVKFDQNCLILVGENGSGKSTVLSILYYILSQDWHRLRQLPFERAILRINGESIRIERKDLHELSHSPTQKSFMRRRFSTEADEVAWLALQAAPVNHWIDSPDELAKFAEPYHIPLHAVFDALLDVASERHFLSQRKARSKRDKDPLQRITDLVDVQILFLPTYRRIERDLGHVLRHLDVPKLRRPVRAPSSSSGRGHIELVEFGMEDVEEAFKSSTVQLDAQFRSDLNRLTVEYLRDVLRGAYLKTNYAERLSGSSADVEAILKRVDNSILETQDISALRVLIAAMDSEHAVPEGKEVAAHFLSKLVGIHGQQSEREKPVRSLAKTCNRYLSDKELRYDPTNFSLGVVRPLADGTLQTLAPKVLSSGEKQIVSLFTHLFLAGPPDGRYFVIIDEPELSISVDWQRMFLPDILATERCDGLVAVTHSPFTFENECSDFAHSIREFWA
ncbi:MAG: AAA family ATPase [Myxococcales bacterium]|nr:AAA family ATPase [Myxococcales bacterium]